MRDREVMLDGGGVGGGSGGWCRDEGRRKCAKSSPQPVTWGEKSDACVRLPDVV